MIRRPLAIRTELMLLLGALVVVATASLGSIAYNSSRAIMERSAVKEVGTTANARRQALIRLLTQQRVRAGALLKTASLSCAPEEIRCLRRLLALFLSTESASAVQLVYLGRRPIVVGSLGAALATATVPPANQIARFEFDDTGKPYYVIVVRDVLRDGEMVVSLRGDMDVVNQIFGDSHGLGQSGETILWHPSGRFLTPPRHSAPADPKFSLSDPMRLCLGGADTEVLDRGYRRIPVILGIRQTPEIGGGCTMALIDQAEAFAPAGKLKVEVGSISVLLAFLAIAFSSLFAQLVSRPMSRLSDRARLLQTGDFDSPVPVSGPVEVRTFAQTFEAMARSLKDSRTALEESTEQIRNILESISDGFIAVDREWRCTYVNANAIALSRLSREQLLGQNLWERFASIAGAPASAALRHSMEDKVPAHFEKYFEPLNLWFEVDAYPARGGLAIFGRDVTERKRLNERLQQIQKLESLGVLAGGIAHDFNNLLTGIIGGASLAMEKLSPNHPVRRSLDIVVSSAERAAVLTRQLLAYAGKGRFVIQPLDLSDLVREISSLLETSIPRTVQVRLQLQDPLPPIEGDAAQIQQLIMNLVINGAEAIGEGQTGTVIVSTRVQEVDEAYIRQTLAPDEISQGEYIALEVHDTGCGMDEDTLRRIFDPFFTTKFAGRGLGLAATTGIVRGHRGALKVYSAPGKGSSFKALFPVFKGEPAQRPLASPKETLTGSGTILVVDDEEVVRQAAKSVLEHVGYTVIVAENGEEGVELFRQLGDAVSLVLLDMTMPVMSGEEALRHLKNARPDVPVILSSGYNETEATLRFAGKGLSGFIQKPYSAEHLAEQVRTALSIARGSLKTGTP